MNYIIIEDEMIACRQLQKIVARLRPDMQLLCILDTVEESLEFFRASNSLTLYSWTSN
mgnify:CR=1 FL=1